ncbi:MAG TPA: hypothetical protein VFY92_12255 [Hyphomicrobiaceae bacterium]|nr:hypothetical protein [Hyphomicrobiaceae bacterium]
MASIFRDLLKPGPNSIPQQLRALLQQSELYAQIAQGVGGGLSGKTPDGHAVQAALVIGDARPHASDGLLGSLDWMLTGHDDRASSTPGKAIAHPGLPYWIRDRLRRGPESAIARTSRAYCLCQISLPPFEFERSPVEARLPPSFSHRASAHAR